MASLHIRLFGGLELSSNGENIPLPQSRKTRALLAYLVLKATPQRRDELCELLWEIPDDPRAALRWSLSKIRPLVNDETRERLTADRERVYFDGQDVTVDLLSLELAHKRGFGSLGTAELLVMESGTRGTLMAGLELPNQPEFETWRIGQLQYGTRLRHRLVETLLDKPELDQTQSGELLRRLCELEPANVDNHVRLIAHLASGKSPADAQQQLDASRKMLSNLGPFDDTLLTRALQGGAIQTDRTTASPPEPTTPRTRFLQNIRFCKTSDGLSLAYAVSGSGPPLVKTANWLNHLEFDWESPVWRHFFSALSETNTLLRYDARGNGLSDWDVSNITLDSLVEDLRSVVDAAGVQKFPLFALSQGCAVALEFALRWPERVSKLILFGGFARGWRIRGTQEDAEKGDALIKLARLGWGQDNPAFRQVFTSMFIPGGSPEQLAWFNELQRVTTSPANAATIIDKHGNIDATHCLGRVSTPTLVIHCRHDEMVPYKYGRELAAGIPEAKFVTLESSNHLILEQEPAWPRFLAEIKAFLKE